MMTGAGNIPDKPLACSSARKQGSTQRNKERPNPERQDYVKERQEPNEGAPSG